MTVFAIFTFSEVSGSWAGVLLFTGWSNPSKLGNVAQFRNLLSRNIDDPAVVDGKLKDNPFGWSKSFMGELVALWAIRVLSSLILSEGLVFHNSIHSHTSFSRWIVLSKRRYR